MTATALDIKETQIDDLLDGGFSFDNFSYCTQLANFLFHENAEETKAWKASQPSDLGDSIRFTVNGTMYQGYITIKYCSLNNLFDVELGWNDKGKYEVDSVYEVIHKDDLIATITENIMGNRI